MEVFEGEAGLDLAAEECEWYFEGSERCVDGAEHGGRVAEVVCRGSGKVVGGESTGAREVGNVAESLDAEVGGGLLDRSGGIHRSGVTAYS